MHWAAQYIGRPWSATGEGPESFNCWNFVRHVQARHFGRDLPEIPFAEDMLDRAKLFRDHDEHRRWHPVEIHDALDGDVVLLRQARYPIHVGIWLGGAGGRVIHCPHDGVSCQDLLSLRMGGWHVSGVYRFQGDGG